MICRTLNERLGAYHMKKISILTLTLSGLLLSGCVGAKNSLYGPARPIQAGKIGGFSACSNPAVDPGESLEAHFRAKACASMARPNDAPLALGMFKSGSRLVHARCNDFFAQKAGTQTGVNTAFDLVPPVVALLTGVLSITDFNNADDRKDYESALAFGSASITSGLKVFEANFLFSAENVESVRKLTVDTLNQHAQTVESLDPKSHSFYTSTQYVIENQMICTPGKMRDLVSGAIESKKYKFSPRAIQEGVSLSSGNDTVKAGSVLDQVDGG